METVGPLLELFLTAAGAYGIGWLGLNRINRVTTHRVYDKFTKFNNLLTGAATGYLAALSLEGFDIIKAFLPLDLVSTVAIANYGFTTFSTLFNRRIDSVIRRGLISRSNSMDSQSRKARRISNRGTIDDSTATSHQTGDSSDIGELKPEYDEEEAIPRF